MQDVEDEPLFADRVAGLDIAKAGIEATIRVPSDTTVGRRQQETRTTAPPAPSWSRWETGCAAGASPRSGWRPPATTCGVRVLESSGRHRLEVRLMSRV
jgi:hypothetical protein